jgi:hypothetical protein
MLLPVVDRSFAATESEIRSAAKNQSKGLTDVLFCWEKHRFSTKLPIDNLETQ